MKAGRHGRKSPGVALVTGASSGIGLATCLQLARDGWKVWAGVRRQESFADVENATAKARIDPDRIVPVDLDVTSAERITACMEQIVRTDKHGPDALIANAGLGAAGFIEELDLATWQHILATNTLGVVACVREMLPRMRARGSGHIVIIGSNAANVPQPAFAPYATTKWAVEGFAESLCIEVAPFGIDVTVMQPGSIVSGFADRTTYQIPPDSPYQSLMGHLSVGWNYLGSHAIEAEHVAHTISTTLVRRRPPLRVRVGRDAQLASVARHLLPGRVRMELARRFYHLPEQSIHHRAPQSSPATQRH